jgi:Bacteriocin-protection, YdeI or OmpD-Associated
LARDAAESLSIPSDLAQGLTRHEPAAACFEQFPRSVKRSILEWIVSAKRPATRSRRVEETAKLAAMKKRETSGANPDSRTGADARELEDTAVAVAAYSEASAAPSPMD